MRKNSHKIRISKNSHFWSQSCFSLYIILPFPLVFLTFKSFLAGPKLATPCSDPSVTKIWSWKPISVENSTESYGGGAIIFLCQRAKLAVCPTHLLLLFDRKFPNELKSYVCPVTTSLLEEKAGIESPLFWLFGAKVQRCL